MTEQGTGPLERAMAGVVEFLDRLRATEPEPGPIGRDLLGSLQEIGFQSGEQKSRPFRWMVVAILGYLLRVLSQFLTREEAFRRIVQAGEDLLTVPNNVGAGAPRWRRIVVVNHSDVPIEVVKNEVPADGPIPAQVAPDIDNVPPGSTHVLEAPAGTEFGTGAKHIETEVQVAGQTHTRLTDIKPANIDDDRVATVWVVLFNHDPATGVVRVVHSDDDAGPWRMTPNPI